jgi:hypothetical protein|tara:strand:+ start:464 stop:805 length:342 start_codon:yes stop_codon:yes gene_type:complete
MTNWIDVEIWFAAFEPKPIHVATFQLEGKDNQDVLEPAFEFTQNIDEPWIRLHQDKLIGLMDCKGLRSMSVGDFIRLEDGSIFQVVPVGFTQVDNMEPVPERAGSTLIDRNAV